MSVKDLCEIMEEFGDLGLHGELTSHEAFPYTEEGQIPEETNKVVDLNPYKNPERDEYGENPKNFNRSEDSFGKCKSLELDNDTYGKIFCCENLDLMKNLIKEGYGERFQMIYMDPPFYSKAKYFLRRDDGTKDEAYSDVWPEGFGSYLRMIFERLLLARQLLSPEGLIWIHLDFRAVHYVKILMDEIFGEENFVNEIIWGYKSGGASGRRFARKHDSILLYGKSQKYKFFPLKEKSYNRGLAPYNFKGVEEFQDEKGWYTLVNMRDVWDVPMVGRTSAERTGYATQKPEELLRRAVMASTEEGDLCGDFFAGSGTLGAVCKSLGRSFVLCDRQEDAYKIMCRRLTD